MGHVRRNVALLALAGSLLLGGCAAPGGEQAQPSSTPGIQEAPHDAPTPEISEAQGYSADDIQTLLDAGVFSGEMEALDADLIPLLYGIDPATVIHCAGYIALNTAQSADEVAVLTLTDEASAQAAQEACQQRVADQLKTCQTYAPAAVPSLEAAVVECWGSTVLLAVGDPETLPQAAADLRH